MTSIIADDLSGAGDTGVQFVRAGCTVAVLLSVDSIGAHDDDLVAIDLDARHDQAERVASKTRDACRALAANGRTVAYLKIDSTLRGQPGTMIDAALRETGRRLAVVAPAFPAMGRCVVGGRLRDATSDERDGLDICRLLTSQHLEPVTGIEHGNVDALRRALHRLIETGARAAVVDARTDAHLADVVAAAEQLGDSVLLVGSGGLAIALAARCAHPHPHPLDADWDTGPVTIIVGSDHPVTQRQLDCFRRERNPQCIDLTDAFDKRMDAARSADQDVLVRLRWAPQEERNRLSSWAASLGERAAARLFLCGGDTARLVCSAAGVTGISLGGEVTTGIPWGRLAGGKAYGSPVVTKSGGFGDDHAIIKAVNYLRDPN